MISRHGVVQWHRALLMDRAPRLDLILILLHASGVPMGYHSRRVMQERILPYWGLHHLHLKGLVSRDPNGVLLEVKIPKEKDMIPNSQKTMVATLVGLKGCKEGRLG